MLFPAFEGGLAIAQILVLADKLVPWADFVQEVVNLHDLVLVDFIDV